MNPQQNNIESELNPSAENLMEQNQMSVDVSVWPTPNPNALKFIVDQVLKKEGKSTFKNRLEAQDLPLAHALMELAGVESLLIFHNTITVTKVSHWPWDDLEELIITTMENEIPQHDPNYLDAEGVDSESVRRKNLTPELLQIEEILDRTIRPGLQADGGDIVCLEFKDDCLLVKYQGACGTCPSSSSGTLEAIKGILTDQLGRAISVYIVPE